MASSPDKTPANLPPPPLEEFDLIARYFAPLAGEAGLGLLDDVACFKVPQGKELVISKDMLVAGTHFFPDDPAEDIAFKAVTANVSDLVAKGAAAKYYLLGLSMQKSVEPSWLEALARGLSDAQACYGIELIGGDTTVTEGPVTLSVTIMGYVDEGQLIKRSGAKAGDHIFVSGTIGDAALGLQAIKGHIKREDIFLQRFYRPVAQQVLGLGLLGLATAAADVSDGLLADVGHICKASGVGARLCKADIPLSEAARSCINIDSAFWPVIWAGGDDYEIVFTVSPENSRKVQDLAKNTGVLITRIGEIQRGESLELVDPSGELVQVHSSGYKHF